MTLSTLISTKGKGQSEKIFRILGLSLFVFVFIIAGSIACKKSATETEASEEEGSIIKEGINKFEGTVKAGIGRYFFVPEVRGLDIIVQGQTELGDASALVGKEVRGEGAFSSERPSFLIANSIEVKESEKNWRNIFTRSEEFVVDDYIDTKDREAFQLLKGLSYEKKQNWEEIEKAKVFGKLEKEAVTEEGEQKEIYKIVVFDEKGNEAGKIIIDNFTDYAFYYLKKLNLFDNFCFYISIKDIVDWNVRQKTHVLFHADVLYTGLF